MSEAPDVALLSIRPQYVKAILDGRKTVEFRRRPLATSIKFVVVYATQPEGKVVAICPVLAQYVAAPHEIWAKFGDKGEIGRREFDRYFEGALLGCAIALGEPRAIGPASELSLADLGASRPPQSFQYVRDRARGRVLEYAS